MECNKDEATRAKQIAEMKMKSNDFEGARKIALKAQNLYPELENIGQLLSVCDVHCSAQKPMLGSEKDWYGILQVEKFADELAVKKQYRRLALFLHPDKNRFPGAEAAFKLICEANAVLSDPTKKSLYDSKIRVTVRSASVVPPPHHINKSFQFNKQFGAQTKVANGFSNLNQHQAKQTSFSVRQEKFCTSCPFCSLKYYCDRKFVNTMLRCQKCAKNFMGYEICAQGVPLESKCAPESAQTMPAKPGVSQSSGVQEKWVPNQGRFTMGVQNGKGFSASHVGSQWNASRQTVKPEPVVRTENIFKGKQAGSAAKVSGGLKTKERDNFNINSMRGGEEGGTCNGDANNRKAGDLKNKRKRGRNVVAESSESYETSSESDLEEVTIEKNSSAATNQNSGSSDVHFLRRSSRKRQNVTYNESDDDDEGDNDDLSRSLKRSQGSKLSKDNGNRQKDALDGEYGKHENQNDLPTDADNSRSESKEMGTVYPEKNLQDKEADHDKGVKARGESGRMSDIGADAIDNENDSGQDSHSGYNLDNSTCQFDEPEFNDFDNDRDVSSFAVNQFWACYDSVDGMPRFYARVRKVCTSPFELVITWLEPDPADEAQRKWIDEELPVGCGSFKLGETEKTSLRLTFSQQVHCEKGKRGSLIILPREGEVWALFKDWDLSWSSKPENHREYKYEVVEVLSDFDAVAGLRVCYLDKVRGFVSLFQRSSRSGNDSFMIRPNELYKFSHRIPHFKMTGLEREGVPAGSLELDPASLPPNPDDLFYPSKAKMGTNTVDPGVYRAPSKSGTEKGNFMKSESSTPKDFVDLVEIDG